MSRNDAGDRMSPATGDSHQVAGIRLGRTWAFHVACAAALVALLAAYSNSFQNSFHFDDSHVVEENLYIRSLTNLPQFFMSASTFSSLPANATYRPLVTATLAFDYWLGGGLQPRQFHISQLVMLIALGVMMFYLFVSLLNSAGARWWNHWAALVASTLFCVHTTGTETMNLMHARSELLSAMGIVGAFLVYLKVPWSRRSYLYLLPMVLGALAKSPAVIFAPLLLVYVWLFEERLSLPALFSRTSWPSARVAIVKSLPALVVGVATFVCVESMNGEGATYGGGSRFAYLLTQSFVWLHYARLFFVPFGLTADTDWGLVTRWYDVRVMAGLLFIVVVLGLAWTASRVAKWRPVTFGIAWFVLGLLPASSIFPLAEVANEHRVFLPYIGLTFAVVYGAALGFEEWLEVQPWRHVLGGAMAFAVAFVAIGGNAVGTFERNKVWRSEETLWKDVTEKSPANGRGLMNYGLTLMSRGQYTEAKQYFDRATVLNPNYASLEINLGIVSGQLGQPEAAEQHFTRALRLQPEYPAAHFFYARWLRLQNRLAEAVPHLQRAIALSPGLVDARYLLLEVYAAEGRTGELKALAEETLRMVPGDTTAGQYLNTQGAIVLPTPASPVPHTETAPEFLNESLRRYRANDFEGSLEVARKALALRPDYAEAYNNIAASYASMGRWNEAIAAAREALRLRPDFPLARNNLAWAESEQAKAVAGTPAAK